MGPIRLVEEGTRFLLSKWELRVQIVVLLCNWQISWLAVISASTSHRFSVEIEAVMFLWKASVKLVLCSTKPQNDSVEQKSSQKSEHLYTHKLLCCLSGFSFAIVSSVLCSHAKHVRGLWTRYVFITELYWSFCCCRKCPSAVAVGFFPFLLTWSVRENGKKKTFLH